MAQWAQVYCYEDSKLLKLFSHVVRILYDNDIVGEDTIKFWYKKGSHPKVGFPGSWPPSVLDISSACI